MKITKQIFRWHHWCGLFVGIFLLMMSITGSILVFSEEIEEIEDPPLPAVSNNKFGQPGFDASFQNIQNQNPDWEIRLYHLPQQGKALVYELRQKEKSKKLFVDPVSGAVLGKNENANKSFHRQLLLLHYTIFSGTTGKIVVFITGVLFLITLVSGLIVYRKSIVRVFTFKVRINRRTQRSFYSSIHRIIGVWSLLFNLLIVSSGLWLSGNIALTAIKTPGNKNTIKQAPVKIKSIDRVVEKLSADYPGYEIHLIRVRPGSNTVQVSGRFKSDPSYYGKYYSGFTFNGADGAITSNLFMKDMPAGQKLSKMAGPLHFGNYGGIFLKILYSLLGFTPAILSISGFIVWRKRKRTSKPKSNLSF